MANIRIIYENIADTATTLTASTSANATTLPASNMQNDYKGKAHRSTGTSVTYTVTWTGNKNIGGVALPATNLSPTATIRVRLYNSSNHVTPNADSGTIYACPGSQLELWNWSQPLNSNSFVYGGASKTAVWFTNQVMADLCTIDLVDTNNTAGYIDCSRLVIGPYWEPKYNVSNGINVEITDTSAVSYSEAGDRVATRGFITDTLSFEFSVLEEADKNTLIQILRKVGTSKNVLYSVFPDNNSVIEQAHLIYGKRSNSSVNTALWGIYKHSMDIEGW